MKVWKILIAVALVLLLAGSVSAMGKVTDLHDASGLKVLENGTLVDTYDSDKAIGNMTPIESVDDGEEIIYGVDSEALEDTLSTDPLVTEYIVEGDSPGIFFMFGHDGDIFLGFVDQDNMGNGMLKRMTDYGKYNGVMK